MSDDTLAHAQAAVAASEESESLDEIASARFHLGFCRLWRRELDAAEEQMQTALSLVERTGNITLQSRCLTFLTISYRMRGQVEAVRRCISRSMALATTGHATQASGSFKASLAWVAWRDGDLAAAQAHGHTALEFWQQLSSLYPLQWTALWPLIDVALAQNQLPDAISYARALLTPIQQRLPDALTAAVEEAIATWDDGQPETARTHLRRAIAVAQELGYL